MPGGGDRPTRELPASVRDVAVLRGEVARLRQELAALRDSGHAGTTAARVILGADGGALIEVTISVRPMGAADGPADVTRG